MAAETVRRDGEGNLAKAAVAVVLPLTSPRNSRWTDEAEREVLVAVEKVATVALRGKRIIRQTSTGKKAHLGDFLFYYPANSLVSTIHLLAVLRSQRTSNNYTLYNRKLPEQSFNEVQ